MFCSSANILSSLDEISHVVWDARMIFFNTIFYAQLAFIRIFSLNFTKILEIYWLLGFIFLNHVILNEHEIWWQGKVEMIFTQSCMNRFVNAHVFETAFFYLFWFVIGSISNLNEKCLSFNKRNVLFALTHILWPYRKYIAIHTKFSP